MKKFLTKLMSLTLMGIMLLSMAMPTSTQAAESYTTDENLAITKLAAIGVMVGTDNGFDGSSNLTRAQAAAIVVRLKGVTESVVEAERKKGNTKFSDVPKDHWALGYINLANSYGIVKGTTDTTFNPDDKVKISELVTMAVRCLNAGGVVDESTKEWPDNYMDFASDEGITVDVSSGANKYATRCETALIVARTIEADTWKVSGVVTSGSTAKNTYSRQEGENILKNTFRIDRYVDETIASVSRSSKTVTYEDYSDNSDSEVPDEDIASSVDLSDLSKGDNVEVWYSNSDDEIIMIAKATKGKSNVTKSYDFSYITKYVSATGKLTMNINGTATSYYLKTDTDAKAEIGIYNGKAITREDLDELLEDASSDEILTEYTGKVKVSGTNIKYIYFGKYESIGLVSENSETRVYFRDEDDVVGTTAASRISIEEDSTIVCNLDGKIIDIDGIKEGFIAKYFYDTSNKEYHIMTYSKNLIGTVTARDNSSIEIDGEEYDLNFIGDYTKPDIDDEIKLYLNSEKEVIMYTINEDLYDYLEEEENEAKANTEEDDDKDVKEELEFSYGVVTSAIGSTSNGKKILRLTIATVDGKESTKYVDLDAMLKLFSNKFEEKSIIQEEIVNKCVGTFVQYTLEDSKFVLYQFSSYRYSGTKNRIANVTSAKLNSSKRTIGNYTYTKSADFYTTVATENSSSNIEASFEAIDVDDLSNSKYSVSLYMPDAESDAVSDVIIRRTEDTAEAVDATGILLSYSTSDDIVTLKLATKNGEKSYKVSENTVSTKDLAIGSYVSYTVIGTVITKCSITMPTLMSEDSTTKVKLVRAKVISIYDDAINLAFESGDNNFRYTKNLTYVTGKISVSSDNVVTMKNLSKTTTEPTKISKASKYSSSSGTVVYCYMVRESGEDYVIALAFD